MGQHLQRNAFRKNPNSQDADINWLRQIYNKINQKDRTFNDWYNSVKGFDKEGRFVGEALRALKQANTNNRNCIKQALYNHKNAIDYCNIQRGGIINVNTSYYVNIAPDDIIVPNEFNECLY